MWHVFNDVTQYLLLKEQQLAYICVEWHAFVSACKVFGLFQFLDIISTVYYTFDFIFIPKFPDLKQNWFVYLFIYGYDFLWMDPDLKQNQFDPPSYKSIYEYNKINLYLTVNKETCLETVNMFSVKPGITN